jgi:SRSO17 transposase
MLNISTILTYPILMLMSIGKKSFENLGKVINKSGDTAARLLQPAEESLKYAQSISQSIFQEKKKLYCIIDDTLIKKIFSRFMQGAGMFFDTKIGRRIMAYRLVVGMISDGKFAIPIECAYLFSKELTDELKDIFPSKEDIAKAIVKTAIRLFPNSKIIVVADGLYSTTNFLKWCVESKIAAEMRMHSNRVVEYNGARTTLRNLSKSIHPKGRQMMRTITAKWHDIDLEISIVRRINKHGEESIVFQCATYKATPKEHVKSYKVRWYVEKFNRTAKQKLGLQDCFSRSLQTQHNHVAAVLLSYALVQLEMKKYKLDTPEDAIRRSEKKNIASLLSRFNRLDEIFGEVHA